MRRIEKLTKKVIDDMLNDMLAEEIAETEFQNSMEFKVRGLFVEQYVGTRFLGGNMNFEEVPEEMEKYHLFCTNEDGNKCKITLFTEYGICGSGWEEASYGHMEIEWVDSFGPFSHRPDGIIRFQLETFEEEGEIYFNSENVSNDVFEVLSVGYDGYYPKGYASITMNRFIPLKRAMNRRPVWIFEGPSGLGKSTLAFSLEGMSVFETDSVDELPDTIDASVVVLGNRSGFTIDEVIEALAGNPKVIEVSFNA